MTMKLIMESWRQHVNEIGMSDIGIGSYKTDFDPDFKKAEAAAVIKAVKELALIFEPTGQIADVDADTGKITTTYEVASKSAQNALDAYEKGDFALAGTNSAIAVLATLAMIPLIGKSAKLASKVPILAKKSILNANKVVATLKKSKNSSLLFSSIFSNTMPVANAESTRKVVETGIPSRVNSKSTPGASA